LRPQHDDHIVLRSAGAWLWKLGSARQPA
jgi:hypothetical protein